MPIKMIRQDITKMRVDAIVNATNEEMIGRSGIDFAVHTIAGKRLDAECAKLAPLEPGCAKITKGYRLPCKYVIHTSGLIWQGGSHGESDILHSCYIESLKLAVKKRCKSVAFPLISSGTYGFSKDRVLKFAIQTITEFLFEHELLVYLCVSDREPSSFSRKLFDEIRAYIDDNHAETRNESLYGRGEQEPISFARRETHYHAVRIDLELVERIEQAEREISLREEILERRKKRIEQAKREDASRGELPERQEETFEQAKREEARGEEIPSSQEMERIMPPGRKEARRGEYFVAQEERDPARLKSLAEYMEQSDKSFQEMLFELIDRSGMSDVACYKKANVDKRTFSKIKSNKHYRPSKQTAIAFAISLQLNLEETQALLATVGFILSRSIQFDQIIRYFIHIRNYDIFEINEALFAFDQPLLGAF